MLKKSTVGILYASTSAPTHVIYTVRMLRRFGSPDVIVVRTPIIFFPSLLSCILTASLTTVPYYYYADVGGGAVRNEVRNNLARISLRWMIRECFRLKTGILFHRDSFKVVGLDPSSLWPRVKERPEPVTSFSGDPPKKTRNLKVNPINGAFDIDDFVNEEEEDLADALSDKNDMLQISKSWWLLELIPQKIKFQTDDDTWVKKLS